MRAGARPGRGEAQRIGTAYHSNGCRQDRGTAPALAELGGLVCELRDLRREPAND